MVSRSEVDLLDIRQEYLKNYRKSLYTDISVSICCCMKALDTFKRNTVPSLYETKAEMISPVLNRGTHQATTRNSY